MTIAKTKKPEIVEENIFEHVNVKKRNELNEREKMIIVNEKIERSKGGGEQRARMYEEFMCAEQESATNLEEPSMYMWAYYFTERDNRFSHASRICIVKSTVTVRSDETNDSIYGKWSFQKRNVNDAAEQ